MSLEHFSGVCTDFQESGAEGGVNGHIRSYHCCLFGVVHLLFNTRFNFHARLKRPPSPPSAAGFDVFNDIDGGGDDYCSFIFGHFYFPPPPLPPVCLFIFILIVFGCFYLLFKGLVGPEWLEAERKGRKDFFCPKMFSYQSTCSRSETTSNKKSLPFLFLSRRVRCSRFVDCRRKTHKRGVGENKGWVPSAGCT